MGEVVPIMCSVDPRRDGPKQIAKYIGQFHPRLVGLTGSVSQVSKFVKTMRAYYSQPPKGAKDYIIDHVTMVYILDRDGEFRDYADSAHTAEQLADKMCECMPDVRGTGFLGRFIEKVTGLPRNSIGSQHHRNCTKVLLIVTDVVVTQK